MTQIPKVEGLSRSATSASSAVSINIYNPKAVNSDKTQKDNAQNPIEPVDKAPACNTSETCQGPACSAPIYSYPQAPIYEMPKHSIYQVSTEAPAIPPPVVISSAVETPSIKATEKATEAKAPEKVAEAKAVDKSVEVKESEKTQAVKDSGKSAEGKAPEKTVEVKEPKAAAQPQVDLNAFISKLTNPDYEVQANAMESIAELTQKSPEQAKGLLDTKMIESLLGIMNKDTTKLAGPTPEQLQIREKILSGKKVTDAETAKANEITPMEQAERNKQYAMYTTALLQKLFISQVADTYKEVVPFAELPGAAEIVKQVKDNPNPIIRASAIDALSYIQRPEYNENLKEVFSSAQKDKELIVQKVATQALEKLAEGNVAKPAESKTAKPVETAKKS